MSAQGNALGGFDGSFSGALKGRGESVRVGNPLPFDERNLRHPTAHLRPYRAKLFYSAQSPRALPWADMLRAVGAKDH